MRASPTETELPEAVWRPLAARHRERVAAWTEPRLRRRSRGERHPVEDFLWEYYSYSPKALSSWHPGWGVTLTGDVAEFAGVRGFVVDGDRAWVDPELPGRRADQVRWIRELLAATDSRPARLGCFGLHEWAMVYRSRPDQVRHTQLPLRLGSAGTDAVVENHRIACSHYDAYRFFTPDAVERNTLRPTLADRTRNEQPGCLHAQMDVYKWAHKLAPFTPAELVADCFALAAEIRELDMRASPYDLTAWGCSPVAIETASGKAEYIAAQRGFGERASGLRQRLIQVCDGVLAEPE
ncbi:MAG: 3-methyladenine DNA glycosylase [Micropruina sp.]|uniref:3-methyladenine DNA glycosylase n=1 Tax=Micropruina sp. TaxID=2737536 RepID=UPI0039E5B328